jgi:hypothetical protein
MIVTTARLFKVAYGKFTIGGYKITYAESTERGGNAGRHCQFERQDGPEILQNNVPMNWHQPNAFKR